jgi:hypothetical protein
VHSIRTAVLFLLAFAVLVPAAGAKPKPSKPKSPPRVTLPTKWTQGQLVPINVAVKSGSRCFLSVSYHDGRIEKATAAVATGGHSTWLWRVQSTAALGIARATVACGRAGTTTRTFLVVGPIAAKVVVDKDGFSQRGNFDGSSNVSFGVVLTNKSSEQDAVDTYVLVNFVDSAGQLLGTASSTVGLIGAGATYPLGDKIRLRTQIPVDHLEITVQTKTSQPKGQRVVPALQNVHLILAPDFVNEVDGEVVNGDPRLTLQRVWFSVVVLDASGAVVGGGTGMEIGSVPPGARAVFTLSTGLDSIPSARAASTMVAVDPSYDG